MLAHIIISRLICSYQFCEKGKKENNLEEKGERGGGYYQICENGKKENNFNVREGGRGQALEVATVIRRRREWTIRSLKGLTFLVKIQM